MNEELNSEVTSNVTRKEWRQAFWGWIAALAKLTTTEKGPAGKKSWWDVSEYYFTDLELEDGLEGVHARGFVSDAELEDIKSFDLLFREYVPEVHGVKVGRLVSEEWLMICAEANALALKLKAIG